MPLKKLTQEKVQEAIRLYESGLGLQPIAAFLGITRQGLWDVLRRRIKLRPQKRAGKDNHFYRGTKSDGKAHNLLEYALKTGIVQRKDACEECGDSGTFKDGRAKVHAHHDDYSKPLEVRWLCQPCHHEWHKHSKAKGRKS